MRRLRSLKAVLGLVTTLGAGSASAQIAITEADRPGVANPPSVIPAGTIQIEAGLQLERETDGSDPDTDTLTVPDLLLRIALVEDVELRIEAEGLLYEWREGADDRALGSDLTLGTKIGLLEARGLIPEIGTIVQLTFPTGSDAATSGGFDPKIDGLFEWPLGESTSIVANTDFSVPTQGDDDDTRVFVFGPSLSLEHQATPSFGVFVEYYGDVKAGGRADEHSLDAGLTWLIARRRLQLDISGGGGLTDAAPDWFVAAGISVRFDAPWAR